MCLRDAIPIMRFINEIYFHTQVKTLKPILRCKLFEDNESCAKIEKQPMLALQAKNISLECHHFR